MGNGLCFGYRQRKYKIFKSLYLELLSYTGKLLGVKKKINEDKFLCSQSDLCCSGPALELKLVQVHRLNTDFLWCSTICVLRNRVYSDRPN